MKVDKKASEPCKVKLAVTTDAAEVQDTYKDVVKVFVREGQIPGFRPGKAPIEVVKQKFHDEIVREVQNACFRKFYPQALKDAKVEAVELDDVTDLLFSPETGFSFTAVVEVRPEFDLPKYKKLSIDFKDAKVTDDQVAERIESFRKAFAKFNDAKPEDTVTDGDFVQIDFKGTIDGKPVTDIAPDAKAVGEGTGFWTQIEEGRFLPEILDALKGMKAGQTKDGIKAKFDKDSAPEALKGKKAVYSVTVKAFRRRALPDDATFVKDAHAESMEKMRADMRAEMEKQATQQEEARRRDAALELLLKKADFDVPESQLRSETDAYLRRLAQEAQYTGLTAEYFEKNRDKILADAEKTAKNQVRISYILGAIAKEEKLEASDADLAKRIEAIAAQAKKTPAEVREALEKNGNLAGLKGQIVAEKALELVLAESKH